MTKLLPDWLEQETSSKIKADSVCACYVQLSHQIVFQITDQILFEESLAETMQQVRREIQCIMNINLFNSKKISNRWWGTKAGVSQQKCKCMYMIISI